MQSNPPLAATNNSFHIKNHHLKIIIIINLDALSQYNPCLTLPMLFRRRQYLPKKPLPLAHVFCQRLIGGAENINLSIIQ